MPYRDTPTPACPTEPVRLRNRLSAEAAGTFLLVFAVVSTATFSARFSSADPTVNLGVGFLGVALALGLAVMIAAFAFAPIAIGLTLTVMLLVSIPIDNASLNPARSLATALFGGGPWLAQVWAFVVFPVAGAVLAGLGHRFLFDAPPSSSRDVSGSAARLQEHDAFSK